MSSFQRALMYSTAGHLVVISVFLFWGPMGRSSRLPPAAISVNLLAAAPSASKPKPKPAPKEKPKPKPKPKPKLKPIAPTDTVVLPKDPKAPKPKPKPEPVEAPEEPVEQVDYADLMEQLRDEAGEEFQDDAPPVETAEAQAGVQGGVPGGRGEMSFEEAAWARAADQHIRRIWVNQFKGSNLQVELEAELDATGNILGQIRVVRRSGNAYYDDSVLRAMLKASPFPAPPSAGDRTFVFNAKEF
ncbi:MAG: TonB C-terminal domain-containing protein [Deltaproteobacteria bacterium]|nr:TonB C-terminal domain-containing protein [Deltaproteobacteria bacterium]